MRGIIYRLGLGNRLGGQLRRRIIRFLLRRLLVILLGLAALGVRVLREGERRRGACAAICLSEAQNVHRLDILLPDGVFRLLPLQLRGWKQNRRKQRGDKQKACQRAEPTIGPKFFHMSSQIKKRFMRHSSGKNASDSFGV